MKKYVAYVGTYTHGNSIGIHVYNVDPKKGLFTENSIAPINNPSYLIVSKCKPILYSIADEGVAAFRIKEDGSLELINRQWIGGMRGCHVEVDALNRYLFVAGYHDGRVTMMHLNEDGSIGEIADGVFHQGMGITSAERRVEPKVTCVMLTRDEKYLCAVDYGMDQIKIYRVDYELGKLELVGAQHFSMGAAPRTMRFSNDGRFCYVMCEGSNTIEVFSYHDQENGFIYELLQSCSILEKPDILAAASCMKLSRDESHVFVAIDALNGVSYLKRDGETGLLTYEGTTLTSGDYPKSLSMLPGDEYFVVLNHDTDEIRAFHIDYEKHCCLMKNAPVKIHKPNSIQIIDLDRFYK